MTSAASSAQLWKETPLARVRALVQLFTIHFCEFFQGPRSRFISRAEHAKASAFLRGLEALARRVLLIEAAAMIPVLPPAKAKPAASAADPVGPAEPAPSAEAATPRVERRPCFQAFRQPPAARPIVVAAIAVEAPPAATPAPSPAATHADLRGIARRYEAVQHALENHTARARRLAYRLRPLYADGAAPQIIDSPRLHPDHQPYLERDLDILREDANDALRAILPLIRPAPVYPDFTFPNTS